MSASKPSLKRIGLLRLIDDFSDDAAKIPAYIALYCAGDAKLRRYGLYETDGMTIRMAVKSGLIRFSENDQTESFAFLTEAGRALLNASKELYPGCPAEYGYSPTRPAPARKAEKREELESDDDDE